MGILKSGWTLAEHKPMLLLVTPPSGPVTPRKVTCRELTLSPKPHLGQMSQCEMEGGGVNKGWASRGEMLSCQNAWVFTGSPPKPSRQVSFPSTSHNRLNCAKSTHPHPSRTPHSCVPRVQASGRISPKPLRGERAEPACREVPGMFSNFTM